VEASRCTILVLAALTACESHPQGGTGNEVDCPEEIQGHVRLAASSVALTLPASLNVNTLSAGHAALVGRRVMFSVLPTGAARGIEIKSSGLTLTTIGGTLAGWAAVGPDLAASNALDVIPGRLRIQPFLRSSALKPQTMALDVLITPGSAPIDEPVMTTSALWGADLTPTPPDSLQITLTPVRHLTVFDTVEGTFTLEVTELPSRPAHDYWRCSFATRFELIDHDSVLPDLWGLRKTGQRGAENEWLALDDPSTGPLRAIFADLQTARGFAGWLRASRATRIGAYRLGLLDIAVPFHEVSLQELQTLEVKRLGE
jgi:hypothetical protein